MKKLVLAAAALSLMTPALATPALAAPYDHGRPAAQKVVKKQVVKKTVVTRKVTTRAQPASHRWTQGQRFDRRYASHYQVISSPRTHQLKEAPRGYQWVRSGNDAVMVALASGLIGAVIGGVFAN